MQNPGKMKHSIKYITLIISAILLISGCKKRDFAAGSDQMIVFQYDFSSKTQHHGYLIDSEGNLFTYSNPYDWNFPDNDLEITREQVEENIGRCIYSGIKIPDEEMVKHVKVIEFIASSKVTAPKRNADEEWTAQFICYQYSENSQKYKGHIIKSEGDISRENLNFHSKRVSSWLRDIGAGLSYD